MWSVQPMSHVTILLNPSRNTSIYLWSFSTCFHILISWLNPSLDIYSFWTISLTLISLLNLWLSAISPNLPSLRLKTSLQNRQQKAINLIQVIGFDFHNLQNIVIWNAVLLLLQTVTELWQVQIKPGFFTMFYSLSVCIQLPWAAQGVTLSLCVVVRPSIHSSVRPLFFLQFRRRWGRCPSFD